MTTNKTKGHRKGSDLDRSIDARAHAVLERLLRRGGDPNVEGSGWRDYQQARKYASAKMSWCQSKVILPQIAGLPLRAHSRRKGGATHRLWARVIELVDAHLSKKAEV